jgi:chromate transport protein ChrA
MRPTETPTPSFREALRTWAAIGLESFGGPAGQIAVMHRVLVEERRWIDERRFLHALNYCMLLPGPEAQQLATYVGWLLHGWRGGLAAGGLFVLPGFVAILALSLLYVTAGHAGLVAGLFFGLKAAVLAVVIEAGILDGDYVFATQVTHPNNGDIIVAGIPEGEGTIKFYSRSGADVTLSPANSTMEPMTFNADDVQLFGRVVTVMRRY